VGRLDGKVTIITGGGSGMGRGASILFAKEGAKVVIVDLVAEGGQETLRMVKEAGGEAIFVKADVSKTNDVKKMINTAVKTYGKLNVLYNNAAIAPYEPLIESTEENWEKVISTNLKGIWLGMKYAIPEMLKTGGGSIINTASFVVDAVQRGSAIYTASKGGVVAMSKVAAVEHAAQNIRVNCIKPGIIVTPMSAACYRTPEARRRSEATVPQRRLGQPEEIAQVALFLASDESSLITGTEILADGGIIADSHTM
jgi:NAD(P)-dependent dehydrogenase (short-subunit alcohol dehydrogenase family)